MMVASYKMSYLQKFLADLTNCPLIDLGPMLLYSDNMGAIAIAMNPDSDKISRTWHIDIHYYITREALSNRTL